MLFAGWQHGYNLVRAAAAKLASGPPSGHGAPPQAAAAAARGASPPLAPAVAEWVRASGAGAARMLEIIHHTGVDEGAMRLPLVAPGAPEPRCVPCRLRLRLRVCCVAGPRVCVCVHAAASASAAPRVLVVACHCADVCGVMCALRMYACVRSHSPCTHDCVPNGQSDCLAAAAASVCLTRMTTYDVTLSQWV